jgi:hypothetical protein
MLISCLISCIGLCALNNPDNSGALCIARLMEVFASAGADLSLFLGANELYVDFLFGTTDEPENKD